MTETAQKTIKIHQFCRHCGRLHTGRSRKGNYFYCKHCGGLNPGPTMIEQSIAATPRKSTVRRQSATSGESVTGEGEKNTSGAKADSPPKSKSVLDKLFGK